MANPLHDIQRAVSSLAILPDIGRHIARMAKDVRAMSQAVQELGPEIAALRMSVESLHVDMKGMVDDVSELKVITHHIEDLNTSLGRLPFVRRKPSGTAAASAAAAAAAAAATAAAEAAVAAEAAEAAEAATPLAAPEPPAAA